MKFTTTRDEQSVSALAARIFGVGSRTAVARRAKAALVEANPALANIKALPAGTPIAVPLIDEATPAEQLASLPGLAAAATIAETRERVQYLRPLLEAIEADRLRDLDERASALGELRRDGVDDVIGLAMERVAELDNETRAEIAALGRARKSAFAAIDEDLDALLGVLTDA